MLSSPLDLWTECDKKHGSILRQRYSGGVVILVTEARYSTVWSRLRWRRRDNRYDEHNYQANSNCPQVHDLDSVSLIQISPQVNVYAGNDWMRRFLGNF